MKGFLIAISFPYVLIFIIRITRITGSDNLFAFLPASEFWLLYSEFSIIYP